MSNLVDDFFLLTVDPRSSRLRGSRRARNCGLNGAILSELILGGHAVVSAGNLVVRGSSATGDDLLDEALATMAGSDRPRNAGHWLSHPLVADLELRVARRAAARRVISLSQHTAVIRSSLRCRLQRPLVRLRLLSHLIDSLFTSGGGDIGSATLLLLLKATGTSAKLVAPSRRAAVDERLERLSRRPNSVSLVIDAVTAALSAAAGGA